MQRLVIAILIGVAIIAWGKPSSAVAQRDEGWLVTARRTDGQSDLWAMPASGGAWRQLTDTPDDERNPAFAPDGRTLIYEARRDRNWDLYALDLRTGVETRLTTNPHFDGYPAWSPDGSKIAFASMREGELDIFLLDIGSGFESNLTPTSPNHDFEPRWLNNNTLVFISTRNGSHDIFRLTLVRDAPTTVTTTRERGERDVRPVADGFIVITRAGRLSQLQRLTPNGAEMGAPFSWSDSVRAIAANPAGDHIAWLEKRYDGSVLYRAPVDAPDNIIEISGPMPFVADLAWGAPPAAWMEARLQAPPLLAPLPTARPQQARFQWVDNLDTLQPELNSRVIEPFTTLRARVAGELGYDFLGELSESVRPVDWESDESDYLSWHKSGRAFDTLLDAGYRFGYANLELVREDQHGEIYWDFWIRCPTQDGTCGEPLVDAPWDFSYEARWEIAPGQGGIPKSFVPGYYVNFTRYAEDLGWERITAYESPTFDWRSNNIAAEFWHYQRTDGLLWYEGMAELFSEAEMDEYFGWHILREQEIPLWNLKTKGVPLPADVRNAPAEIVVP